jgi:hypothetical protein
MLLIECDLATISQLLDRFEAPLLQPGRYQGCMDVGQIKEEFPSHCGQRLKGQQPGEFGGTYWCGFWVSLGFSSVVGGAGGWGEDQGWDGVCRGLGFYLILRGAMGFAEILE